MTQPLDIVIRALEPDDYADVAAIYNGPQVIQGSVHLPFTPQDLWRRRTEISESDYPRLVAAVEGMIVGIVNLEIGEYRRRHTGWIEMAVRDDYQGRGVGAALLTAIIDLAEQWLGLIRLELVVFTDNHPAIALYKRMGFVVEGTFQRYVLRQGEHASVYAMARIAGSDTSLTAS